MKKRLLTFAIICNLFGSCQKKEELYEVDIPDSIYQTEEIENTPKQVVAKEGAFKMKGLNYEYYDLEPHLDAQTVEHHYSKHHLQYLEKLNELIKGTAYEQQSIEEVLSDLTAEDHSLIINAGGYYNHNLYWEVLNKPSKEVPEGKVLNLITRDFGSIDNFKSQFKKAALDFNGSGWIWLVLTEDDNLKIVSTTNENNPLMGFETTKGYPLLNLDVWEHAYYLKYKNNKKDYVENFFKLIDWKKINYRLELHNKK